MVFRFLLRYFANNEQLVNRIADSYPIRKAARFVVYLFAVGREAAGSQRIAEKLRPGSFRRIMDNLESELKSAREEFKEKAKQIKNEPKK